MRKFFEIINSVTRADKGYTVISESTRKPVHNLDAKEVKMVKIAISTEDALAISGATKSFYDKTNQPYYVANVLRDSRTEYVMPDFFKLQEELIKRVWNHDKIKEIREKQAIAVGLRVRPINDWLSGCFDYSSHDVYSIILNGKSYSDLVDIGKVIIDKCVQMSDIAKDCVINDANNYIEVDVKGDDTVLLTFGYGINYLDESRKEAGKIMKEGVSDEVFEKVIDRLIKAYEEDENYRGPGFPY